MALEDSHAGDYIKVDRVVYVIVEIVKNAGMYTVEMKRVQHVDSDGENVDINKYPSVMRGVYKNFGTLHLSISQVARSITHFKVTQREIDEALSYGKKSEKVSKVENEPEVQKVTYETKQRIDKRKFPCWWLIAG